MNAHTPGLMKVVDDRQLYIGETLIAEVFDTAEGLEGSDAEADANAALLARLWNERETQSRPPAC